MSKFAQSRSPPAETGDVEGASGAGGTGSYCPGDGSGCGLPFLAGLAAREEPEEKGTRVYRGVQDRGNEQAAEGAVGGGEGEAEQAGEEANLSSLVEVRQREDGRGGDRHPPCR